MRPSRLIAIAIALAPSATAAAESEAEVPLIRTLGFRGSGEITYYYAPKKSIPHIRDWDPKRNDLLIPLPDFIASAERAFARLHANVKWSAFRNASFHYWQHGGVLVDFPIWLVDVTMEYSPNAQPPFDATAVLKSARFFMLPDGTVLREATRKLTRDEVIELFDWPRAQERIPKGLLDELGIDQHSWR